MATVIGDGAHAKDILATFRTQRPPRYDKTIPHHTQWDGDPDVLIAVNNPQLRAHIATELGVNDHAWWHPKIIWADLSTIGIGTHVNYAVSMTRTIIGDHCTISPGVTICGDVTIGNRVLVGAGATICDRVTIGDDVTIGAGCVVLPETTVPDGETWVGVPARQKPEPRSECWFQFRWGGICTGDHSRGFHSYMVNGREIDVKDAPIK